MFNFLVTASLRNRLFVLAAALILVVYGAITLRSLPVDVFPDLNRPTVTLVTEAEGLAPEEVEQLVTFPLETAMNGMPGVVRVRSVSGVGLSIIYIEFDWGTNIFLNRQQVTERLSVVREQLPRNVNPQMAPITSIMGEIMLIAVASDEASPMEVRELVDWVVRPRLLTIPGIAQVIPIGGEVRQYRATLNLAQMMRLDITRNEIETALKQFGSNTAGGFIDQHSREYLIRNLARTTRLQDLETLTEALETLLNGRAVSQIIDGNRRHDVVLRVADADRTTEGLSKLTIETPAGRVPLSSFAQVVETDGPNQIQRDNTRRRIVVLANTDGSDMARIIGDIRSMLAEVQLPAGYSTALEGTFQAQEEATRLIGLLSLISLGAIFTVLYSRYRSAVLSLIIMGNIPLALIGSVTALWLAGQPLSVATMIGFITLAGISARNGILKISHYINLVLREGETFGPRMIVRGSLERLTPVLMTALSAGFALLPLMVGADAPGKEILHPVAIVVFGGLITSTLLDTILTPVLFLRYGAKPLERLGAAQVELKLSEAY